MCGESANRCSPRVRARPSMRGQVGPDVQPPAPRLPGWRTTLLGAPRGKTALMRTKMAMESCSLMTRQQWTAACARRCAQMAWPWKTQHLHDVLIQPTRRKSAASKTPRESLPFARPLGACLLQHRVTVNYLSQKPDKMFRLVTAKPKRNSLARNNCHYRELRPRTRSTPVNDNQPVFFRPCHHAVDLRVRQMHCICL